MSTWQKIKLGLKFVFGSFEGASDYLLGPLNEYLGKTNVASKVAKAREYVGYAFTWLTKLEPYCPAKWAGDYAKVKGAVEYLFGVLDDGQVSGAELQAAVEGVTIAYKNWTK